MKQKLFMTKKVKHLFYCLCLLFLGINLGFGQVQTLGSFPYMDGGFEGQTATTTMSSTVSTTAWSVSATSSSTTRSIVNDATAARTGNKYANHVTSNNTIRLQSPSTATAGAGPAVNTQYTVQYYFKTTTDPATGLNAGGIYNDGVSNSKMAASTIVGTWSSNVWTKAYSTITSNATQFTPYAATGFGAVRTAIASNNLYDDFVIYPGAYDSTAPSAASSPSAAIASATAFSVGWSASADTDKTGYMVVRYSADPSANGAAVPNVNGIYAVGNTILNGSVTGTVAYVGADTSFTDPVADTAVQAYYRIFTIDKAFNYSTPLDLTTVVDNTPPGNTGLVTVSGATATTLAVSWLAATSIDGGGYMVVRYATNPNANNDPTQKAIYVAGGTYTNGTGSLTGTVVYVGTDLTVTDSSLLTSVTYYYKVYTFDQAHNYSGETSGSGTTTAAVDNSPPNDPGTASISNQTTTSLTTNWNAASGGVDGGGYLVVRYSGDPSAEFGGPTQKSSYAVNDTYANGVTAKIATVVYVGPNLTCITTGLSSGNYTYFKIYTFDAAHNYSAASYVKGKTAYQFVAPTALDPTPPVSSGGFTANWNLLDSSSLTPAPGIYTVKTYTAAATTSTVVGWTIPATVTDTDVLTADSATANNTTKTLTQNGGGTIDTSVTGNPGFAARGSTYYSTNIISGTEGVDAIYATAKTAPDKYWQVEVNTVGYINPTISSHQYSTATGPRDWKLQYSSTGTAGIFTDLVSSITLGSAIWNTAVSDVALPVSCQNNPNVVLRWVQTSFTNTNAVEMTTPSTGGTSRIDNILIKGLKLTAVNTADSSSATITSKAVTGLAGGNYYYDVVASKNSVTDSVSGVVSSYVASPNSNLIAASVLTAQAVADYRSTSSGSMDSTSIWQYFDAIAWQTATAAPTSANNITISAGHTITLGSDFVVNTGKTLTVTGTIDLAGHVISGAGSFTLTSAATATLKLGDNASILTAITSTGKTFGTAANYVYNGTAVQYLSSLPIAITGNLTISNTSTAGVYLVNHTAINTPGVVTVAAGTKLWFGDGQVTNSAVPGRGTFNLTGTGAFTAGNGSTLVVTGSKGFSLGSGNMAITGTRTWGSDINFWFYKIDGFTVMQMGDLFVSEITSINNLVVNDPYGVYLGCVNPAKNSLNTGFTSGTSVNGMLTDFAPLTNITIKGNLTFISGKLIANNGTLKLNLAGTAAESFTATDGTTRVTSIPTNIGTATVIVKGSIIGAGSGSALPNGYTDGKWVVGNLKKLSASAASPSFTYAIGDATNYTPLTLTFSGVTSTAGGLTARINTGDHASIASSGIVSTKSVNRTWTLANDALAGFGTYNVAFTYASADNDLSTAANFGARLYSGSAWSDPTTSGTPTNLALTATGISGFGDFAIGEFVNAPVAISQTLCNSGTVANLSATGTALKWYSASSGGTALATSAILVSGNYYVSQTIDGVESLRTSISVTVNGITSQPANATICKVIGGTAVLSVVSANPNATYQWQAQAPTATLESTWANVTNPVTGSAIYAGGTSATLIITKSSLVLPVTLTKYRVKVTGSCSVETSNSVTITDALLPVTPSLLVLTNDNAVSPLTSTTAVTAVGFYAGTNTPFKLTATAGTPTAATTTGSSYLWTLPSGVVRTDATGTTTDASTTSTDASIYVKFTGTGSATSLVINVQSVNASGCTSLIKASASITRLLPAAPAAIKMTDALLPLPLTGIPTAVTSFAKYMGTTTELTLTATASVTATSYVWELPTGVNITNASATLVDGVLSSGSNNFITVNFAGVTKENTYNYNNTIPVVAVSTNLLRIGVKSVNGVGVSTTSNSTLVNSSPLLFYPNSTSTAKLLTLTAVAPAAPALVLNNTQEVIAPAKPLAITVISKLIGQGATYRLTAAVSVLASSYSWELPSCVTRVTSSTGETAVTGNDALKSIDPFIYIKFNGSTPVTALAEFGVKAVNGIGSSVTDNSAASLIQATNSTAKLLRLATVVPVAPATLVLNNGVTDTAIPLISSYIGQSGTYRLAATVPVTTLANSFAWELPSCVTRVTNLGGLTPNTSTTSTDPFIYVKFNGTNPLAGVIYFGVKAVNGVGSSNSSALNTDITAPGHVSSEFKLLKLVTAVPAAPATLVLNDLAAAIPTTAVIAVGKYIGTTTKLKLIAGASVLANTYSWTLPTGVNRVDESGTILNGRSTTDSFIYVNFANVPHEATPISLVFGVTAVNNVGSSTTVNVAPNVEKTAKLLTVTAALPAVVATVSGALSVCNRLEGFSYIITAPLGANRYIITAPVGSVVSSVNGIATAAVGSLTNNVLTTSDLTFKVVYAGTTSFSLTDKNLVIRSVNDLGQCLTAKSIVLTKLASCSTLTTVTRLAAPSVTEAFKVLAYPNPYRSEFQLDFTTASESQVEMRVYDMIGRLIEVRQMNSDQVNNEKVGNNYASGIYNVIVTQDANVKTLRVLKQ